jgi:hypothetical protein
MVVYRLIGDFMISVRDFTNFLARGSSFFDFFFFFGSAGFSES